MFMQGGRFRKQWQSLPCGHRIIAKSTVIGYILGIETTKPKQTKISAFFKGFASAFDISGKPFMNDLPDFSGGFARDGPALRGDWQQVGDDLRKAMGQVVYER
jgi:hypothetical protein